MHAPGNAVIAAWLEETAALLEGQHAHPWRVLAYRRAAETVARLPEPVHVLARRGGRPALETLPRIGPGIAGAIDQMVRTGRWGLLERLRDTHPPADALRAVPGVGPALARALHDQLHVDTIDGLAMAALAGRLTEVPGVGPRRARAIEAAAIQMLDHRLAAWAAPRPPPVALLLEVDREYRARAEAGTLPLIAPKRFNPDGRAWLPVLHTSRGGWDFTALYSNTERAHRLDRTRDWVVIYAYDADHREVHHTVVTETHGPFAGQRVVRGRAPPGPASPALFDGASGA